MNGITLDPITGRLIQSEPIEKICYVCSSDRYVDNHHYDCLGGKISKETVPMCRRCHTSYRWPGINCFEDEYLDRIIMIENKRREILGIKRMVSRSDIKRSKYWLKQHKKDAKKLSLDSDTGRLSYEG